MVNMTSLKAVTEFEFSGFIKKKKNWSIVIIIAIISALITVSPFIYNFFSSDSEDKLYIYMEGSNSSILENVDAKAFFGEDVYLITNKDELNKLLADDTCTEFYDVSNDKITYYTTKNSSIVTSTNTSSFSNALSSLYMSNLMIDNDLASEYEQVNNYTHSIDTKQIELTDDGYSVVNDDVSESDLAVRYFVGYFFLILTYVSMLQFGSYAATTVANEKTSRTMESLIYSTDTNSLILGKVLGVFFGSLIQIIVMVILLISSVFIAFKLAISQSLIPDIDLVTISDILLNVINIQMVLLFVILYALGFLMTLFIFASLASTVTKVEELSSAISTGTVIAMFSFFVGLGLLMNPASSLLTSLSYFPFFTPITMFARYIMGTTSTFDLVYAIGVSGLFVALTGLFASKVYKMGVLLYGTKPSFKVVCKEVFKRN